MPRQWRCANPPVLNCARRSPTSSAFGVRTPRCEIGLSPNGMLPSPGEMRRGPKFRRSEIPTPGRLRLPRAGQATFPFNADDKIDASRRGLPPADQHSEPPPHLGLRLLDPRLERGEVRGIAIRRLHKQYIFYRFF